MKRINASLSTRGIAEKKIKCSALFVKNTLPCELWFQKIVAKILNWRHLLFENSLDYKSKCTNIAA